MPTRVGTSYEYSNSKTRNNQQTGTGSKDPGNQRASSKRQAFDGQEDAPSIFIFRSHVKEKHHNMAEGIQHTSTWYSIHLWYNVDGTTDNTDDELCSSILSTFPFTRTGV